MKNKIPEKLTAILTAVSIMASALLCGCGAVQNSQKHTKTVYAMDTVMELTVYVDRDDALDAAADEIARIDSLLDRNGSESEIFAVNSSSVTEVSDETAYVLRTALDLGAETDGLFDVTIAPVMDLWGFYGSEFYVPNEDELSACLGRVDYRNVSLEGSVVSTLEDTCIDLGGIAKGYTSDMVIRCLKEAGVTSAVISLGGNVQTLGTKPDGSLFSIAVTDPFDTSSYVGMIECSDMAVITSGGYQRYFERDGETYHHIIDPRTGYPSDSGLASVTVVSESGILADGLSTSLFVMGLWDGIEFWREKGGFDAVFITDDNKVYITSGLKDSYSSNREYEIIE